MLMPAVEERMRKTKAGQEAEALANELVAIESSIKDYALANYKPSEGYADDEWLVTHVQGHTRRWNVDVLRKVLTPKQFKDVIDIKVSRPKIDALVRAGTVTSDDIEPAFEETPNAPYVKITPRSQADNGDEADDLAASLGL